MIEHCCGAKDSMWSSKATSGFLLVPSLQHPLGLYPTDRNATRLVRWSGWHTTNGLLGQILVGTRISPVLNPYHFGFEYPQRSEKTDINGLIKPALWNHPPGCLYQSCENVLCVVQLSALASQGHLSIIIGDDSKGRSRGEKSSLQVNPRRVST